MQISNARPRVFYAQVAKRFFGGSKDKEPVEELILTALGSAMNSAVAVSDSLVKNKVATITQVETSYYRPEEGEARNRLIRNVPKLTIRMKKDPDFKYPVNEPEGEAKADEVVDEDEEVIDDNDHEEEGETVDE